MECTLKSWKIICDEARRAQNAPPPEDVYRDMLRQALIDGEIVEDEIALLATMRQAFGIDMESHERLLERQRPTNFRRQQQPT